MNNGQLNDLWGQVIIEELIANGVEHFFFAPGSRSTPIISGLHCCKELYININVTYHYDERSLAFMALGYAKKTNKASVVITTSGSAVANCLPAVVEAYNAQIPLIILSADRPPELHDVGANQSINQNNIFGVHADYISLPEPSNAIDTNFIRTSICYAYNNAKQRTPVHLNIGFREPLFEKLKSSTTTTNQGTRELRPYTQFISNEVIFDLYELLQEKKESSGLIILSELKDNLSYDDLTKQLAKTGWPILVEVNASIRNQKLLDSGQFIYFFNEKIIAHIISCIKPKTLLHLGSNLISRDLEALLNQYDFNDYIHVSFFKHRQDESHKVRKRVVLEKNNKLIYGGEKLSDDNFDFKQLEILSLLKSELKSTLNEISCVFHLAELVQEHDIIFSANSMVIRDFSRYCAFINYVEFFCNRGASGIDGILSTTIGIALATRKTETAQVFLVVGDLSFIYDLSVLSFLKKNNIQITVIILNNFGGGIFSFLPVVEKEENFFENFIALPHEQSFEKIIKSYGFSYENPETIEEYKKAILDSRSRKVSFIEVFSDRKENVKAHQEINNQILELF